MNIKRYCRYADWLSFSITLILSLIGLLFVFSSTYTHEQPYSLFFKKQIIGIITGFIIYFFFSSKDIQSITQWGFYSYFATLLLLSYTIVSGKVSMGGRRWISLYFFRLQPSELVKFTLPFFLALFLIYTRTTTAKPPSFLEKFGMPLLLLGITFLLIRKQPDLGTALLIVFSGAILLWVAGIPRSFFITLILGGTICAPLLWHTLRPYQQKRIMTLFGHGSTNNERYQIEQSKIAIGSGGLWGKGLLKGTQNKLSFLPEDHTDFIFAVICEEWGFTGALFILFLFLSLFLRLLCILASLHSREELLIGLGMVSHLLFSVIINIGMVIGLLPIVGIPLPFLSYGIASLWISFASLGVLQNLAIRRYYY